MFLSNPRKSFLLIAFCVTFFQACGSPQTNENKEISLTGDTKSEFPFSTKEPEVYQGDFVVSYGNGQQYQREHIVRKAGKWRVDSYWHDEITVTHMLTGKLYYIVHKKKMYALDDGTATGPAFNEMASNLFRGQEHREFDELKREGNIITYAVREPDTTKGQILIYVDSSVGMIVKQEFKSWNVKGGGFNTDYVYEVRNLKLEVDDSSFAIPGGYKKVLWRVLIERIQL